MAPPAGAMPAEDQKPPVIESKTCQAGLKPSSEEKVEPQVDDASFSSLLSSPMVNIYVGSKRKQYHIHRALLCSTSAVFKAHFGGVETKDPVNDMYLPNHDPRAFEMFVSFLYRKSFPEILPLEAASSSNSQSLKPADVHRANLDALLNLYFMSSDWALPDLQNATLDHISRYVKKTAYLFRFDQIKSIYERTNTSKAPLRRFAVDHFVHSVMKKSIPAKIRQTYLRSRITDDNSAFLFEVIEAMISAKKYPTPADPFTKECCEYHEHPKGERCEDE
ncbi:MAG: hypothetical protein Q9184_005198 [Pyrenodesmia sp. 2 TL-2023]